MTCDHGKKVKNSIGIKYCYICITGGTLNWIVNICNATIAGVFIIELEFLRPFVLFLTKDFVFS